MKKWLNWGFNFVFAVILVVAIYKKAPEFYRHFKLEGEATNSFRVATLSGDEFDSEKMQEPFILVFWATWCGPCGVELSRLNRMILNNEVKPEAILAIAVREEMSLVAEVAREKDYRFKIGIDSTGKIADSFHVQGTPTIVFIGKDKTVKWITTGISPSLEYRVKRHLD